MSEKNNFQIAVVTISDRCFRGEAEDGSGHLLQELAVSLGNIVHYSICPDEQDQITSILEKLCDGNIADLILTTGGTGFSPRDVTPEATLDVIERKTPGIDEMMRAESLKKTPFAVLSRGVSGIRKQTLIVNLPGSPKAVKENMQALLPIIPHGLKLLKELEIGHTK